MRAIFDRLSGRTFAQLIVALAMTVWEVADPGSRLSVACVGFLWGLAYCSAWDDMAGGAGR